VLLVLHHRNALIYQHHDSDNEDEGSEHDDDDDDGSGDGVDESNSRDASIARMSHMHGEGVPESVYRSIEAKRLAGPQTGVKVSLLCAVCITPIVLLIVYTDEISGGSCGLSTEPGTRCSS
jgi:hypothetical protein